MHFVRAFRRLTFAAACAAALILCCASAGAQQRFATPEAAASALIEALRAADDARVQAILGPELLKYAGLTDKEMLTEKARVFVRLADAALRLEPVDERKRVMLVGPSAWPMAVPLTRTGDAWHFDVAAGREEILNRIVGENEIEAINACLAYVRAQESYMRGDHVGDRVFGFAQRLLSTPGRRDGLYWPAQAAGDRGPLAEELATAGADAPVAKGAAARPPVPHYGYILRILTRQGVAAPGGAHSYLVNGNMIAGHALVAYPASWGESGVMTFMVGRDGRVFQKNLGPRTTTLAAQIMEYNPDNSWRPAYD